MLARALFGLHLILGAAPSTLPAQQDSSSAVASIGRQCLEFRELDARECQVSESGEVGTVGNRTLLYAIYCIMPGWTKDGTRCGSESVGAGYHRARALAVFSREETQSTARLLFSRAEPEIGILHYEKPRLVRTAAGIILHLPIVVDGTGHGNSSEYYLGHNGEWERIDSESWVKDVVARLPAGLEIENPRLVDSGDAKGLAWLKTEVSPQHTEFRDDRLVAAFDFFGNAGKGRGGDGGEPVSGATVAYIVRAVTPGSFVHPAATVEDMYRPSRYARTSAGRLDIVGP